MTDTFTTAEGTEVTPEMQAKKAQQIGKLIAMSQDESLTPEARASYAEKAERMMRDYRIDEEQVISTGGEAASLPIAFEIVLMEGEGRYSSDFEQSYMRIWREISIHAGLKSHTAYRYEEENGDHYHKRLLVARGNGYEIDVRLAQFLWTAAHLTFATRIDTKVDRALSDQLNCYYMRGSGKERNDIANALWGSEYNDGVAHGKVQKLYLAECAVRGESPTVGGKGFQAKRYREAYANGFVDQFGWRLRDARSAVDAESGALVLRGRAERVAEAYYADYPDRAPKSAEERAADEARNAAYWAAQEAEETKCRESGPCSKAKTACRKHRQYKTTEADRRRWSREANAPEQSAGRRAGAAAASSVDFSRTGGERRQKAERGAERQALQG